MIRKTPLRWLVDQFSNVWLGIVWAGLLFVYCSVGSAMPSVRKSPALEMTEFEWFHWWPFVVLVALLCTTLIVVTIRRIPFRLVNLGVWTIHSGIIILCIGSYYYFSTKVEGDTPVFRRQVRIEVPGVAESATLPALAGSQTSLGGGSNPWHFQVQSTNSAWPILSDEHQGETAYAVSVMVTPPGQAPFIRQLLAGYPQYTEDIIPGKGRAIKSLGRKLVEEDLKLTLALEPQEYFQVMDTWALFVRHVGETNWIQRPIHNLPRYHERIGSRDQVFTDPHYTVPLRTIDLVVPGADPADALRGASVRITGYLRYAHMQQRFHDGGDRLNPALAVSLLPEHAPAQSRRLVAFDRLHNRSEDGLLEFRWLDDSSLVESLPSDARAILHVSVPKQHVEFDQPILPERIVGHQGPFTDIKGTDFAYRILNVQDNLVLPGPQKSVSVAMVEIRTPDGQFTRMVADQPSMTRDMTGDHPNPHANNSPQAIQADPRITMTYQPQSAPLLFAAHPNGLYLVANGPSGRLLGRSVRLGEVVEIVPGLSVRADRFAAHALFETKPYIVPPPARRSKAGETFAMIQLEVNTGHGTQSKWLPFNHYVLPNEQYAYSGRFSYSPQRFRLPDGTWAEVLFSRRRRRLPNPVALEDFALDTHVGGYNGQALTIRNYVSKLAFLQDGRWTDVTSIKVNEPTEHGGYWFFQSTWDKPSTGNPAGGMNYTGLGVGNRHGVHIQLAGCCIAVAGMLFAFYVKPVLKRRRAERSRAKIWESTSGSVKETVTVSLKESVEV